MTSAEALKRELQLIRDHTDFALDYQEQAEAEAAGYVKICRCGYGHTLNGWRKLVHLGEQEPGLELRQCVKCNTTLARRVPR